MTKFNSFEEIAANTTNRIIQESFLIHSCAHLFIPISLIAEEGGPTNITFCF